MTDFIIVGQGLAANVLMHSFRQRGISFKTVGTESLSNCSRIAAGIWNPVVFKRLTKSWLANDLVPVLNSFYTDCESTLGKKLITQRPIIKPFTEEQEKQLWLKKSRGELEGFLEEKIHAEVPESLSRCNIQNGFGIVEQCGNLNVAEFITQSTQFFKEHFIFEIFDYNQLKVSPDKVTYGSVEAKHIIFCEGHLVKNNPFFNWIPLKPAKGEVLTVNIPGLGLTNAIFNRNGFLMDVAPGIYKIGATYEWQELTDLATEKGLEELTAKLKLMIDCDYSLVKQEAGIRPSSIDRRPIIGAHPKHKNLFVFNGLGTKGVMLAPFFAKNFVNFYLQKEIMNPDVDLARFYHLYEN